METPTDEILSRGGAYSVEERAVPGPDGQPDISLLICFPKHAATPTAAIYHIHGGYDKLKPYSHRYRLHGTLGEVCRAQEGCERAPRRVGAPRVTVQHAPSWPAGSNSTSTARKLAR